VGETVVSDGDYKSPKRGRGGRLKGAGGGK